jgi:outer membrane immunogenic protein
MSVAAATMAAAPAFAADLPVAPATAYNPQVYRPALYNWTGVYVGGNVGAGWLNDTVTYSTTTALEPAGTETKYSDIGFLAGAQMGFDFQAGPIVFGAEAAWDYSALSSSNQSNAVTPGVTTRSTGEPHYYVTATGRLGVAFDDILLYAKGGAAWTNVHYTQDVLTAGVANSTQTQVANRLGFVVGGGLEYGLTENLSLKAEYEFLDFGSKDYTFNIAPVGASPTNPVPVAIKSTTQMFLLAVNYRFRWPAGSRPLY